MMQRLFDRLAGEVHVWHAELSLPEERVLQLARTLNEEERRRAARLQDPEAAAHFVAARGILREILGSYLEVEPAGVDFDYEEHGKPFVVAPTPLHFNVSHAGDRVLVAFSSGPRVGVDMERVRPLSHPERIARRAFSEPELLSWLALAEEHRLIGFFERWTRMEALAKLLGHGVWRLLADRSELLRTISFHQLSAPPGFIATVAVEGSHPVLREHTYSL
jgi:4'-phosphopantetheinyl transferase